MCIPRATEHHNTSIKKVSPCSISVQNANTAGTRKRVPAYYAAVHSALTSKVHFAPRLALVLS